VVVSKGKLLAKYFTVGYGRQAVTKLRRKFHLISLSPDQVPQEGISIRWWDFLFYITFGLIVTVSVRIVGVLLIFSYLIIPAVCAMLLVRGFGRRLIIGWIIGTLTSIVGLHASCTFDFPTGASIVCSFGLVLIIVACVKVIRVRH